MPDNTLETVLSVLGIDKVIASFQQLGADGAAAFNSLARAADNATAPMTAVSKSADTLAASFGVVSDEALVTSSSLVTLGKEGAAAAVAIQKGLGGLVTSFAAIRAEAASLAAAMSALATEQKALAAATAGSAVGIRNTGSAARQATTEAEGFALSTHEISTGMHIAIPALKEAGVSVLGFRELLRAGHAGVVGIAAAIGGILVVAIEKASETTKLLQDRLSIIFGRGGPDPAKGKAFFEAIEQSAERAGISTGKAATAFEAFVNAAEKASSIKTAGVPGGLSFGQQRLTQTFDFLQQLLKAGGLTEDKMAEVTTSLVTDMTKIGTNGKQIGLTGDKFRELKDKSAPLAEAIRQIVLPFGTLEDVAKRLDRNPLTFDQFTSGLQRVREPMQKLIVDSKETLPQAWERLKSEWERLDAVLGAQKGMISATTALGAIADKVKELRKTIAEHGIEAIIPESVLATVRTTREEFDKLVEIIKFIEDKTSTTPLFGNLFATSGDPIGALVGKITGPLRQFFASVAEVAKSGWEGVVSFFEDIANKIGATFKRIGAAISGAFSGIAQVATQGWDPVVAFFSGIVDKIRGFFSGIGETVSAIFKDAASIAMAGWDGVVSFFEGIVEKIKAAFRAVKDFIVTAFQGASDSVQGAGWDTVVAFFEGIVEKIKSAFKGVKETIATAFQGAADGVTAGWDTVVSFFEGVVSRIKGIFSGVADAIGGIFSGAVKGAFSGVGEAVSSAFGGIKDAIGRALSGAGEAATGGFGGIGSFFSNLATQVGQAFDTATGQIKTKFSDAATAIQSSFQAIDFAGIAGKLTEAIGQLPANAQATAQQVVQAFVGAASGIGDAVRTALQGVFQPVVNEANTTAGQVSSALNSITFAGLMGSLDAVIQKMRDLASAAQSASSAASSAASSGGGDSFAGLALGGLFRGRAGRDRNIIAVSDFEYIVNPTATRRWLPILHAINRGDNPFEAFLRKLRGFDAGGLVESLNRTIAVGSPRVTVPAFASGGLVRNQSTLNLQLTIGNQTFGGMTVTESTARALEKLSIFRQSTSAGTKMRWRK